MIVIPNKRYSASIVVRESIFSNNPTVSASKIISCGISTEITIIRFDLCLLLLDIYVFLPDLL